MSNEGVCRTAPDTPGLLTIRSPTNAETVDKALYEEIYLVSFCQDVV